MCLGSYASGNKSTDFFIRLPLVHVELMVALEQLNLSVEQSHRGNNGQTDCGGENQFVKHFCLPVSVFGLLTTCRAAEMENPHQQGV